MISLVMPGKVEETEMQTLEFNENQDSDASFDDDSDGSWRDDTENLENLLEGGNIEARNAYTYEYDRPPVQCCTESNFRILAVILMIILVIYSASDLWHHK